MNTESVLPSRPLDLQTSEASEPGSKTDAALASLEKQLQEEADARKEERFVWIVVCTLFVDIIWFRNSSNAILPILALVLELVILFVLARRMQIDEITILMSGIVNSVGQKVGGNN